MPGVPGADPGAWVWLGATDGHPGRGTTQVAGVDRYAIAAFTLSTGGPTSITNSLLRTTNFTVSDLANGVELLLFVNSTPMLASPILVPRFSSASFNLPLGSLSAGDTIYAAVGPNTVDFFDGFAMDFTIQQDRLSVVPEPSTLILLGSGLVGAARAWRKRKA